MGRDQERDGDRLGGERVEHPAGVAPADHHGGRAGVEGEQIGVGPAGLVRHGRGHPPDVVGTDLDRLQEAAEARQLGVGGVHDALRTPRRAGGEHHLHQGVGVG